MGWLSAAATQLSLWLALLLVLGHTGLPLPGTLVTAGVSSTPVPRHHPRPLPARAPQPTEGRLRVLTWNIHRAPLPWIEEDLRASDADIIALQEVSATPAQLRSLATSLGMQGWMVVLLLQPRPFGLALLSRRAVTGIQYRLLPSGREPRAMLVAVASGMLVVNTHLEPSPRRRQQLQQLLHLLAGWDGPALVLGDLNEEGLGPLFAGFEDAARSAGITYPPLQARIDYVLVRGRRTVHARVIPTGKSDHWAVLVELE